MKNLLKNMRKIFSNKKSKSAYSLIELSIVILIISILITGALSVSVSSINNAKIKTTNDRIREVYKALGSYLVVNGKLPCPAPLTDLKSSTPTYGTSVGGTNCTGTGVTASGTVTTLVYGMVPVKTLGLASEMAEDGFESKLVYIMDYRYAVVANATATGAFNVGYTVGATIPPTGTGLTITEKPANNVTDADIAIISHGANKAGAFGTNSSTQAARSTDADEQSNDNLTTTTFFDAALVSVSGASDTFDDIVFAKRRYDMIMEFGAYSSIPCLTTTSALYSTTITWPYGIYDQAVVSSTACPSPTYNHGATNPVRRCGAFGQWGAVVNACT